MDIQKQIFFRSPYYKGKARYWLLAQFLLAIIAVTAIIVYSRDAKDYDFIEGDPSPVTVRAQRFVRIFDEERTEAVRSLAREAVPKNYITDFQVEEMVSSDFNRSMLELRELAMEYQQFTNHYRAELVVNQSLEAGGSDSEDPALTKLTPEEEQDLRKAQKKFLRERYSLEPQDSVIRQLSLLSLLELMDFTDEEWNVFDTNGQLLLKQVMANSIREEEVDQAKEELDTWTASMDWNASSQVKDSLTKIVRPLVRANYIYDEASTESARELAESQIDPVTIDIKPGQVVVRKGDILTKDNLKILEGIGELDSRLSWVHVFSVFIIVAICFVLLFIYVDYELRDTVITNAHWSVIFITFVFVLVATIFLTSALESTLFIPVATASMLLCLILDIRVAMISVMVLGPFVGLLTESWYHGVVGMLTGMAAASSLGHLVSWNQLFRSAVRVAIVNALLVLAFSLQQGLVGSELVDVTLMGGLNGLLSIMLVGLLLPVFERTFGMSTGVQLLELGQGNHPLLQKLMREAPGTYQHSVMVANLSEKSAQAIGANAFLCKVGAYFHDIGKLRRPRYFTENQVGDESPHSRLSPSLSAVIITNHTKEGLEMAEDYNLPEVIKACITQHHGTSLVKYFYYQACEQSDTLPNEDVFRYDGPKPQTREVGVLMICDGVEASTRSIKNPTKGKLDDMVDKIIDGHLADGQLDECGLSLKDIQTIRYTLKDMLQGIYHARIEYPESSKSREEPRSREDSGHGEYSDEE